MTSVRKVLLETLAPAGGGKAQDRVAANPYGTLTVTPDAPDWGSPINQLSSADSPTGFLEEEHGVPHFCVGPAWLVCCSTWFIKCTSSLEPA
jgi:hypothetical protein